MTPLAIPEPAAAPATAPIELAADEVHLWQSPLAGGGGLAGLPPEDRARAERLRLPAVRARFVTSRTLLRTTLAAYTGQRPGELRFGARGQGKPVLAGPADSIRFNLSRTDAQWLLAVARGREVGVDVERLDRAVDVDGVASRLFSARERATLRSLDGARSVRAFFRVWACREAVVKAMGEGMLSHADRFEVEADPGRPVAAWPVGSGSFPWRLGLVPVPEDHVAVLAVEGAPGAIRSFRRP